ncbi:hypothetical protein VRRI112168_02835 [Vreelandella rituensis]|uniref:DUF3592 domain-containing protein n=1 Tax=Vreelandella rituensis TaxID=2282306 RepID=A0A368U9A2_9GAMM|nr:hypothetical protein [Halomonas rituensis]RCV93680.1 hypothetical protein DU506_00555 [Halomonas rituensis]
MFTKLVHFWNVLQTSWQDDPAARGAAKMAVGAILTFEGLFGSLRDIADGPNKKTGGIFSNVIAFGIGVALIFGGGLVEGQLGMKDPVETQGVVVKHERTKSSDKIMYREYFEFIDHYGQTQVVSSRSRSTHPLAIGKEVVIKYERNNLEQAVRADGIEGLALRAFGHFDVILKVLGWVAIAFAVVAFTINVAFIAFGIKLLMGGRRERAQAGQDTSLVNDLFSLLSQLKSGELSVKNTAAGRSGRSHGGD